METPNVSASVSASLSATGSETRASRTVTEDERVSKEFETVFISQFVDQMMKTVDYGPTSGGQGAEMWRSFLSQAMAEQLSERGGLGLSANIEQMLGAYRR